MFIVIEVPDGTPEEVAPMVQFVGTELEKGLNFGLISPEFRWSVESEIA